MQPYKAVIFDIDGTIIDTEKAILHSLQRTLRELEGWEKTEDEIAFVLGVPGKTGLAQLGVSDIDHCWEIWDGYFMELSAASKPFDGVPELIEELKRRGIPLGIVTSKSRCEWEDSLERYPCLRSFDAAITADDTLRHKPEAEPMLAVLEKLGADAQHAVYLGDTEYDMRCAAAAGVDGALAVWGCRCPQKVEATHKLDNPQQLLKMI